MQNGADYTPRQSVIISRMGITSKYAIERLSKRIELLLQVLADDVCTYFEPIFYSLLLSLRPHTSNKITLSVKAEPALPVVR